MSRLQVIKPDQSKLAKLKGRAYDTAHSFDTDTLAEMMKIIAYKFKDYFLDPKIEVDYKKSLSTLHFTLSGCDPVTMLEEAWETDDRVFDIIKGLGLIDSTNTYYDGDIMKEFNSSRYSKCGFGIEMFTKQTDNGLYLEMGSALEFNFAGHLEFDFESATNIFLDKTFKEDLFANSKDFLKSFEASIVSEHNSFWLIR